MLAWVTKTFPRENQLGLSMAFARVGITPLGKGQETIIYI